MDPSRRPRNVLVTGGARGIGYAAAVKLAGKGDRIVLADLDGARAVAAAERLAHETGARTLGIGTDVADPQRVDAMIAATTAEFGPPDVLINSAAVLDDKTFLASTRDDWRRMIDVCLYGPMNVMHALLPGMVERGYGRVVLGVRCRAAWTSAPFLLMRPPRPALSRS
ncbi:MAG: SDR family NAD(P)-dependent oxidoreductase [Hyphomicrobiaceae bacterium]